MPDTLKREKWNTGETILFLSSISIKLRVKWKVTLVMLKHHLLCNKLVKKCFSPKEAFHSKTNVCHVYGLLAMVWTLYKLEETTSCYVNIDVLEASFPSVICKHPFNAPWFQDKPLDLSLLSRRRFLLPAVSELPSHTAAPGEPQRRLPQAGGCRPLSSAHAALKANKEAATSVTTRFSARLRVRNFVSVITRILLTEREHSAERDNVALGEKQQP